MGSLKQLEMLGDETLLQRAVRIARQAGCDPVIVVVGAEAEQVQKSLASDVVMVINDIWQEGMGSSVRAGVDACVDSAEGVVMMTCDQPAVTAAHLRLLMAGGELKASRYAGRNGVPAFFPRRHFADLTALNGDVGARDLLRLADAVTLEGGELDVDTPADLARARMLPGLR